MLGMIGTAWFRALSVGVPLSQAVGASSPVRVADGDGAAPYLLGTHLNPFRVSPVDDVGLPYQRDIRKLAQHLLKATSLEGRAGIKRICLSETCTSSPADLLQRRGIKHQVVRILSSSHPISGNGQAGPVQIWPGFTLTGGSALFDGADMWALGVGSASSYHGLTIGIGVCDGPSYQRWCEINFSEDV